MQSKRLIKIILPIAIVVLIGVNIYFLLNRTSYSVNYVDEITYKTNNELSNFDTEQGNYKKFSYSRNDNLINKDYLEFENQLISEGDELPADTSSEVIFDKGYISSKVNLETFTNKSVVLPLKYSKYFDYLIYGESEPELAQSWNFTKLKEFKNFYIDLTGYTNEFFILPGPLSTLELMENTVGYLKENGIEPSRIFFIIDIRNYVWPDRFFESNVIMNYTDKVQQAEILDDDQYMQKYSGIEIFRGTTEAIDPSYNKSHVSLSLKSDLSDIIELAKKLGLQGFTIQDGRTI